MLVQGSHSESSCSGILNPRTRKTGGECNQNGWFRISYNDISESDLVLGIPRV